MKKSLLLKNVLDKGDTSVGCGKYGQELATELLDRNIAVRFFFDNRDDLNGLSAYGIPIRKPCKINELNICYIIAVDNQFNRYKLKMQLIGLGIDENEIQIYFPHRCSDYNATLKCDEYKSAVEKMYLHEFNRHMNWEDPQSYNEKINWEKFNLHDDRRAVLADKNKVRDWVNKKIGA